MRFCFIIIFGLLVSSSHITASEKPYTLSDCITFALEKSPYKAQISSNINTAQAAVLSSISNNLPQVSFTAGFARNGPEGRGGAVTSPQLPIIEPFGSPNNYQTTLSIRQMIVDLPNWFRIREALHNRNATEQTARGSVADLIFNIKQAYFSLLESCKLLIVAETSVKQNEEQASIARERFRLGAINRPDLLQVEIALTQAKSDYLNNKAHYTTTYQRLANLLGIKEQFSIDTSLAFPDTSGGLPDTDSLISLIDNESPSFLASISTLEAQQSGRQIFWLSKIPTFAFGLDYGYSNTSFGFSNWSDHYFYNINFDFTVPIFNGASSFAQLRQTNAQITNATASRDIAYASALEQVHQSYGNLRAAYQNLSLVEPLRIQADESYSLMLEKFRLGAASSNDLLSTQVTYTQSMQRATRIIINYYIAQSELLRIYGTW